MKPYRVLSLDGGGMRGLYTATLLRCLAQRFNPVGKDDPDIGKAFDLIVGTSTGGILACGLASGVAISDIIRLYKVSGPNIFVNPMPTKGALKQAAWAVRFNRRSPNDAGTLKAALTSCFAEDTIEEMYQRRKIGLCLTAVKLATYNPRVFKTPHNPAKNLDDKYKLVDLCLATSAAPLYLPLSYLETPGQGESDGEKEFDVYVDGGLWANNPALIGLTEALSMAESDQPIEILSIGTCPPPTGESPTKDDLDWGTSRWEYGRKALRISMDAQSTAYELVTRHLAEHLTMCSGRKISFLRLDQSPPPANFADCLVLDRADQDAQRVLMQMGQTDGLLAHSKALVDESHMWVKDALTGLPFVMRKELEIAEEVGDEELIG